MSVVDQVHTPIARAAGQRGAGGVARGTGGRFRLGRVESGAVFDQFAAGREALKGVGATDARRRSHFAVGLVAACEARNQEARARVRLRHKNCRWLHAGARAEQGALPLSGSAPCAGRDGKQEAPSSPVAVFNP